MRADQSGLSSRLGVVLAYAASMLPWAIWLVVLGVVVSAAVASITFAAGHPAASPLAVLFSFPLWSTIWACPWRRQSAPRGAGDVHSGWGPTDLRSLVDQEAAKLHVVAPDDVHYTLRFDVALRRSSSGGRVRRVVAIGLPALISLTNGEIRALVCSALLTDADRATRMLDVVGDRGVRSAEISAAQVPIVGSFWRAVVHLERRALDRASAQRRHELDMRLDRILPGRCADARDRAAGLAVQFDEYWADFIRPALRGGYHPPILEGWLSWTLRYDGAVRTVSDSSPATWIEPSDYRGAEVATLARTAAGVSELVPLPWERYADAVFAPAVAPMAQNAAGDAPTVGQFTNAVASAALAPITEQETRLLGLGYALALALRRNGWQLRLSPGEALLAWRDEATLFPLAVPFAVARGGDQLAAWETFVEDQDIADLALGAHDEVTLEHEHDLSELPTALPAMEQRSVALSRPKKLLLRRAATFAVLLFLGMPTVGLFAWEAATLDASAGARVFVLAMCVMLAAVLIIWFRADRRRWAHGTLTITGDRLYIEHPGLLRARWEVSRKDVSSAIVDNEQARVPFAGDVRFAVAPSDWDHGPGDAASAWLWTESLGRLIPELRPRGAEPPNFALIFTRPLMAPRVRGSDVHAPLRGEAMLGLALTVDEPAAVSAALHEWDVPKLLQAEDAMRIVADWRTGSRSWPSH